MADVALHERLHGRHVVLGIVLGELLFELLDELCGARRMRMRLTTHRCSRKKRGLPIRNRRKRITGLHDADDGADGVTPSGRLSELSSFSKKKKSPRSVSCWPLLPAIKRK